TRLCHTLCCGHLSRSRTRNRHFKDRPTNPSNSLYALIRLNCAKLRTPSRRRFATHWLLLCREFKGCVHQFGKEYQAMLSISKILLPVDFSGRSIGGAQYGKALACRFHSELHIVHVVDLRVYGMYGMGNDEEAAFRWAPGCQEAAEHEMNGFLTQDLSGLNVR